MMETMGPMESTTLKAEIHPSGSEMSLRPSEHIWAYG